MAQQVITIGTNPNDDTGELLRSGGSKINNNFTELYALQSDTINAGAVDYNFSGATKEQRIALAETDAIVLGKSRLRIPASMIPYNITQCPASVGVHRLREGGNDSVYEPEAYGAGGDNIRNDYANVQSCVTLAAALGTVVLNRMFLSSSIVTVPSNSELTGLGWQTGLHFDYVLQSVGEAYIINANSTTTGNTNIRLRDFTVTGAHPGGPLGTPTPSQCGGVLFRRGSAIEVRNLQIQNVPGISLVHQGIDRFVATNNYIHDGGRDGITGGPLLTFPSTDVRIQGNTIFEIHDDLIACNQSVDSGNPGSTQPTGWSIAGNVCRGGVSASVDNYARGIYMAGALDCTIENNQITNTNQQGIYVRSDETIATRGTKISVLGNTIKGVGSLGTDRGQGRAGIEVYGVDNIQIQENRITGAAEQGLLIQNVTEWQIQNNSVTDCGATSGTDGLGMYANGNSATTTDGIISGNKVRRSKSGGIYVPNCDRVRIFHNEVYNNGQSGVNDTLNAGIVLESTATAGVLHVHDNVCYDNQGTKTQTYGLTTRGALAFAYVSLYDNYFVGHKTGSQLINNAPTVFPRRGNQLSTGAATGRIAMVNGTITVSTTEVVTADNIQLTRVVGAGTTRGELSVGTIVNATSFVINATDLAGVLSADDDSTVFWEIVH